MIFASLTEPGAVELASFVACLFFLVAGWNQVEKLLDRRKDKPAPGDVRAEAVDRFTSKEVFNAHVAQNQREHENLFAKIGGVERGIQAKFEAKLEQLSAQIPDLERRLNAANETRIEKVHNRVNEILGEVREMRGELNHNKN